jgi:hypothetical protein
MVVIELAGVLRPLQYNSFRGPLVRKEFNCPAVQAPSPKKRGNRNAD